MVKPQKSAHMHVIVVLYCINNNNCNNNNDDDDDKFVLYLHNRHLLVKILDVSHKSRVM